MKKSLSKFLSLALMLVMLLGIGVYGLSALSITAQAAPPSIPVIVPGTHTVGKYTYYGGAGQYNNFTVTLSGVTSDATTVKIPEKITVACTMYVYYDDKDVNTTELAKITAFSDNILFNCPNNTSYQSDCSLFKVTDGVLYDASGKGMVSYPQGKTNTAFIIPSNVTKFYKNVFSNCKNLDYIFYPDSYSKFIQINGYQNVIQSATNSTVMFEKLPYWYSVKNNEATIERYFSTDSGSFTVPSTIDGLPVTGIAQSAFNLSNCPNVTEVIIPKSIKKIADRAFDGAFNISSIVVNSANSYYSSEASANSSSDKKMLYSKDKKKLIKCPAAYPSSVVKINSNTTTIGNSAFDDCINLSQVYIPVSVKTIEAYAFYECNNLSTVSYAGSRSQWDAITISEWGNSRLSNANIICAVKEYKVNFYDGSNLLGSKYMQIGSNYSLSYGSIPTKSGYIFKGWSKTKGSTSAQYTNGQQVNNLSTTDGAVVNMYAVWQSITPINSVTVTSVSAPVVGEMASFYYNIPSGAGYAKYTPSHAAWIETDTQPTNFNDLNDGTYYWVNQNDFFFKANKYYTFRADVVAEENFIFSDPFSAKINGNTANVRDGGSYKSIWYCFGKLNTLISSVNITGVTAPVAGATANFNFTLPSGAGYAKHSSTVWIETDTQPTVFDDLSTGTNHWYFDTSGSFTFKPDKYYTFYAVIAPIAGYAFSSSLTAKINGYTAKVQTRPNYNLIWYCFGKPAAASPVINTVTVTGVTSPVVGATASFNYNLPSGAGYVKDTQPNAVWIETDSKPNTYGDLISGTFYWSNDSDFTFKPNKYYTFRADIKASSGYTFSSSFTAKINGNTANVRDGGSFEIIWYCFGKTGSGSLKTLSSISVTTQPTYRIYTAGQNFDPKGMVVKANYSDGTSKVITNYTVTDGNNLPAGKTYVTISYTEGGVTKTTKQSITVNPAPVTFTGIEITHLPNQLEYKYKSNTSTEGMEVIAKYSNGTTKDVTDQINIINFDAINNKKGTHTAMVGYKEDGEMRTATFDFTVKYTIFQWVIIILLFGFLWY